MKKGVTLVEVLASSLILAIAISSLLWGFVIRQELMHSSSLRLEAGRLLNQRLEELNRIADAPSIGSYLANSFTDSITPAGTNLGKIGYTVKFSKSDVNLGNLTGKPNLKIRQVTATAEWFFKGKKENLTIVTRAKF